MKTFDFNEIYPLTILIVSDNKDKIRKSIRALSCFCYRELVTKKEENHYILNDIMEELIRNKKLRIGKGDFLLEIDLSEEIYSNKGKRRNMVLVDENILPTDEIEKKELIEDLFDPITEIWGLNYPIKNIPKTFII